MNLNKIYISLSLMDGHLNTLIPDAIEIEGMRIGGVYKHA